MKKILFILGTRPEAIKLVPLIKQFQEDSSNFETIICVTAQHREMLDQVLSFFEITPHYDLNIMKSNQTLFDITFNALRLLEGVIEEVKPDLVLVQGDATTVFVGALAAYYKKVKIAHIEAGLRSYNKYSPYPEEINRILVDHMADFHFAHTESAKQNLISEGIKECVWVVGNTGIDALMLALNIIKKDEHKYCKDFKFIDSSKKIVLVTAHRRESFGKGFEEIFFAIKEIAESSKNVDIVYPVHLNPNVKNPAFRILKHYKNVHLIDPLNYSQMVWLMSKSYIVLTDSGGIQEEAPSLGKPVLVMRDVTERLESIEAGTAKMVGTNKKKIIDECMRLLTDKQEYKKMSKKRNPYGDGRASRRIIKILKDELLKKL